MKLFYGLIMSKINILCWFFKILRVYVGYQAVDLTMVIMNLFYVVNYSMSETKG